MKNMKYVFQRLADMNYQAMFQKLNELHAKTHKSRISLLLDMWQCATNYGAGYMDYDLFEMYQLTPEQRDTYLTRGRNNALILKYNDLSYAHFFDNKDEFNTRFGAYIKRDWINVKQEPREAVEAFMETYQTFIIKPLSGCCGRGIEKVSVSDFGSPAQCYDHLMELDFPCELEQLIVQHASVSAIYPHAINTVRAVTICKDGVPHLICTYFRIGNNGKPVDNFNNGGMVAPVDEMTGLVMQDAIDKHKVLYEKHPMTGNAIKGFRFPYWQEVRELVLNASAEIPQMGYIGWDVAFTPDGPCLVEGNNFPGHDIYQLPEHTPSKIGMMKKFDV